MMMMAYIIMLGACAAVFGVGERERERGYGGRGFVYFVLLFLVGPRLTWE